MSRLEGYFLMKKYVKYFVGFGILIWLVTFIVSIIIYPIREDNRVFFESIMPVILTLVVIKSTILFFIKVDKDYFKEGIIAGTVWIIISLILDLMLFIPESQMHIDLSEYFMDIGFTYLIIFIIPAFIGYLLERKQQKK